MNANRLLAVRFPGGPGILPVPRAGRILPVIGAALLSLALAVEGKAAVNLPVTLTCTTPNGTYNTIAATLTANPSDYSSFGLGPESQNGTTNASGSCSANLGLVFNLATSQATVTAVTFNLQNPGQILLTPICRRIIVGP